ncbi:MAG: hypothetical protein OXI25_04515 [Chloroflexota bacterium]|nr:hypothetical protein [Chloroflexota bacterium]
MIEARVFQPHASEQDAAFVARALDLGDAGAVRAQLAGGGREAMLADARLFNALTARGEPFVHVSPGLFFEALLLRAVREMGRARYTIERDGAGRVPVFDAPDVASFAAAPGVVDYLAHLLASFTRIEGRTARVRVRRGVWRKSRSGDLDVRSLVRRMEDATEEERLPLYKRTADTCLFILGVFPDYAALAARYPGSGALRPRAAGRLTAEEYETIAHQAYAAASVHRGAPAPLAALFERLSAHVAEAKKPLNLVAERYLGYRRTQLFGWGG